MTITAISKYKKHLMKITLDSGEELFWDKDIFSQRSIKAGTDLSDGDIESLNYESDYIRAKSRALWYLDRSDYTEKALYLKLLRAGFDKKASAAVIARFTELEIIDDRRFAERFCERCTENNISKRETFYKLTEKGVSYDLAKEMLDSFEVDEEAQLAELIEKKYSAKLQRENGFNTVYAALVRKGFSYGAVKSALKKYNEELEFSEEY